MIVRDRCLPVVGNAVTYVAKEELRTWVRVQGQVLYKGRRRQVIEKYQNLPPGMIATLPQVLH